MSDMKFRLLFLSLLALLVQLCGNVLAESDNAAGASGNVGVAQDKAILSTSYPRLYFTEDKLKELRQKISDDTVVRRAWEDMLKLADRLVEPPCFLAKARTGADY
jgi:hypothetical protein